MEVPIRVDVPADYHPGLLVRHTKALDREGTVGPAALAAGREALTVVCRTYAAINDAEKALIAESVKSGKVHLTGQSAYLGELRMTGYNPRRFNGREEEFAEASDQAFKRTALTIDRRNKELVNYREALEKKVAIAIEDSNRKTPEGLTVATEIRSHVKSMKDKALGFVFKAITSGDKRTVAAVLSAPAYLSGLTEENLIALRKQASLKFAEVEQGQLDSVDAIIKQVRNAANGLLQRWIKTQELKTSPRAESSKKLSELAGVKS